MNPERQNACAGFRYLARSLCLVDLIATNTKLTAKQPNLALFISDDHGYRDSSSAGSTDIRTPQLDRIARDGMTFTRAFAVSPSCAPSRAALLTGLLPLKNGAIFNHQPPRGEVTKLPTYLKK